MLNNNRDIEVVVTFLDEDQGGMAAYSGYFHPQFYYKNHDWDVIFYTQPDKLVVPGEQTTAYLVFLNPEILKEILIDDGFSLRVGKKIVANGNIIQILSK